MSASDRRPPPGGLLATVTHARLRAAQGDLKGARRVLRDVLRADPDNTEARGLLELWASAAGRGAAELDAAPEADRLPAGAADLAARFRSVLGRSSGSGARRKIRRLEEWLGKIRRGRRALPGDD